MNLGSTIYLKKTSIGIFSGTLLFILFYMSLNKNDSKSNIKLDRSIKVNLYKLLNVAIQAAENGGKQVVESKDNINIQKKGLTKEGLIDSVTTADFLSHCSMIKTLKHFYPFLEIISEEAKTVCDKNQYVNLSVLDSVNENELDEFIEDKDITVWIDPLDATYEYTGMCKVKIKFRICK